MINSVSKQLDSLNKGHYCSIENKSNRSRVDDPINLKMEVSSDMLRSTDAPPSSRMMKDINLDPLGINKYDRIFEKFNRLVSTTKEDTNDLALLKYDSECLRAVYDMKTSDRSENVVVSDDNVEVQIIQCPRPTSANSDPMSFVPEKDAAVDAKLKRVGPKNDLLAATRPKYFVGTQNNSNVDTDKKSTRRVQEDPPEECTTCTLSPSMKYIDTMRDFVSSSRLNSTSVASRDDYGSSKPIYEIHFRDDDIMLFDDSRSRVNSRLEMLNAKSRAFKARLERGDFDGHSLPSTVHESEVRNLNCDWQSSGSDKNGFKTQLDSIKNSTAEVKEKSYVHDTQSTNVMDRKSVCFSEIGVYRDGSGADKSVLLNSERPDTKMSGVKHRSLRSNLLSYQAADLERPSQRAKELVEIKEQFQPSALKSPKLNKDIATRVISEKILQGHMMTRSNCARCGMSLLLTQESAVVCVCCPLMRLRSNIRGGVAKRELAKLVADGYTVCHGNLCTSCHSPKVIKSGDEVCLICPVLDNAIIGFVRAESKGFVLAESSCGCGAKKMKNRSGIESCMICSPASKIADDCIGVMGKEDEMEANEDTAVIDAVPFSASIKSICSMDTAMITNSKIIENSESVIDLNGNAVPAPTDDADKEDEINDDLGLVQDAGREPVFNVKVETGTEANRAVPPRQVATNRIDPTHLVEQRLSVAPVEGDDKPGDDDPVEKESKLLGAIGRDTLATEQYAKSVHCPSNIATGVSTLAALQEQLKAEIEKAKHWQAALDSTIEKTPEAEMTIPDIGLSTEENAIGSPDSIHSYSISQQEVERGVMKEYIPPKRYFFHKGIPSEVIVDNLQADSVAQSYHTNHLKNTQKISSTTSNISDCFGISSPPKKVTFDVKEYEGFDDETIQTDEDTVDFTWNTWDDSMVDTVNVDDESKKNVAKVVQEEASESNGLCCFVEWLRCGYFDDKSSPVDQEKDNIVVLRGNLGHGNQPPEQTETVHRVPSIYGDSHSLASISREKGMHFDPPNELRGSVFDHQHLVRDDSGVYTDTESLSASKSSIGNIVRIDRPECAPVNPGCAQNAKSTAEGDCYAVPSSNSAKHYVEVQHIDRVEKHSDLAATQLESPKSQSIKVMGSTDKKEKESSAFYNDAMHLISQNQLRDTEKSSVAGYGEVFEPHQQTEEDWDSNSVNIESVWNDSISLNDYSEPHSFRLSATVAAGDGAAYGTPTSGECRQKVSSASYGCHGGIASTVEYDRYEMRDKYSVPPSE